MNTKYKYIITALALILVIILIGGWYMHKKNAADDNFWKSQKTRIELYYTYNFNDIHSFTYTDSKKIPTGAHVLDGYVNNDPQLYFHATVDPGQDFEGQGGESAKLSEMIKPEFETQTKSVSQILKEKNKSDSPK